MKNDLLALAHMFDQAGINYIIESNVCGWPRRLRVNDDVRAYVFDTEGCLAGIRSLDDQQSYDGD